MHRVVFLPAAREEAIEAQDDDAVYVIACFHSSRDPRVWRNRMS